MNWLMYASQCICSVDSTDNLGLFYHLVKLKSKLCTEGVYGVNITLTYRKSQFDILIQQFSHE